VMGTLLSVLFARSLRVLQHRKLGHQTLVTTHSVLPVCKE
jgi:hypothetical protein